MSKRIKYPLAADDPLRSVVAGGRCDRCGKPSGTSIRFSFEHMHYPCRASRKWKESLGNVEVIMCRDCLEEGLTAITTASRVPGFFGRRDGKMLDAEKGDEQVVEMKLLLGGKADES